MHTTPSGRFLGRKRDLFDPRDLFWTPGSRLLSQKLPSAVDVCAGLIMPPIFDQGNEGSCTANAGIRFFRWLALKHPTLVPGPHATLSRQAQYYWERALPWNDDTNQDAGASTRDIYRVLQVIGTCPEADDPYLPSTIYSNPGPKAVADAYHRRIKDYYRITSVQNLKLMLASGQAGTVGFALSPENAASLDAVGPSGIWTPNLTDTNANEGHETFLHGYDDSVNGGSFLFDNSWGAAWGAEGKFWMPYDFLEAFNVSQWDSWTGHLADESN